MLWVRVNKETSLIGCVLRWYFRKSKWITRSLNSECSKFGLEGKSILKLSSLTLWLSPYWGGRGPFSMHSLKEFEVNLISYESSECSKWDCPENSPDIKLMNSANSSRMLEHLLFFFYSKGKISLPYNFFQPVEKYPQLLSLEEIVRFRLTEFSPSKTKYLQVFLEFEDF